MMAKGEVMPTGLDSADAWCHQQQANRSAVPCNKHAARPFRQLQHAERKITTAIQPQTPCGQPRVCCTFTKAPGGLTARCSLASCTGKPNTTTLPYTHHTPHGVNVA